MITTFNESAKEEKGFFLYELGTANTAADGTMRYSDICTVPPIKKQTAFKVVDAVSAVGS